MKTKKIPRSMHNTIVDKIVDQMTGELVNNLRSIVAKLIKEEQNRLEKLKKPTPATTKKPRRTKKA